MKLIELVDKYLENPYEIHTEIHKGYHHPSSSSCIIKNIYGEEEIVGSCLRKVYWDHRGTKKSNPMSARGSRICAYGKAVERFEVEQYKQIGIWRDNNVKFINAKYNVSGEADCIVFDKDKNGMRGVEVKSGYDYKFRSQVIGTPTRPGSPKYDHLLQTMLYVDYFKFPFNIVYVDRGNAARNEYEITLNPDGTPNINGNKLSNGLSIPRCIARYKELEKLLEDSTIPKRDFQLKYSKEKLDKLSNSSRLRKKQAEEFDKSGDIDLGDWQCSYCDYRDYCWTGEGKDE
jgi:hypothetical protein